MRGVSRLTALKAYTPFFDILILFEALATDG
jgi:hypothetical protein